MIQFDVAIIGGGLSGLLCGITLQKKGLKCVIFSSGECSLIISPGSFDLLGKAGGKPVDKPLEALHLLSERHPYNKIGAARLEELTGAVPAVLSGCGIAVTGTNKRNMQRITPIGKMKSCWLSLEEMFSVKPDDVLPDKVLIAEIEGFLDLNTAFVAEALEKMGCRCRIALLASEDLTELRKNSAEFRSISIARLTDRPGVLEAIAESLREQVRGEELILVPSAFGLRNGEAVNYLTKKTGVKVKSLATLPPSTTGIRIRSKLKAAFEAAGGIFIQGDNVETADIAQNKVKAIYTQKLENDPIVAENYVLASGSFLGRGLRSDMSHIYEPVFGADVISAAGREYWYSPDFLSPQAYESFGVATDSQFRLSIDGQTIENLYGIGMVLGGMDVIEEQSKEGVETATALAVSSEIISRK